jgi:hypothetical protein
MLARKITSKYTWEDIVLPPDRLDQLREICNHMKYRGRVYNEWGFDEKLPSVRDSASCLPARRVLARR